MEYTEQEIEKMQQGITNYSTKEKDFLKNILAKVSYLDWKFSYDFLCFPTEQQVKNLYDGSTTEHLLRINIMHYGVDTDPGKDADRHWLTYCGCVVIKEWSEKAILEAIYIALIQKIRHEVSETFKFDGEFIFHEHKVKAVVIPE